MHMNNYIYNKYNQEQIWNWAIKHYRVTYNFFVSQNFNMFATCL
jgi:hypothetical protein